MGAPCATAPVATISQEEIKAFLERAAGLLAAEDYALLSQLIASFEHLTRLIRQQETTLARLRRLVGGLSTEKKEKVLPPGPPQDKPGPGAPGSTETPAPKPADSPPPKPAPKPKAKGHGRIPSSDYPDAERIPIKHECLCAGHLCPECGKGHLYSLDPVEFLRIFGQAPLIAMIWLLEHLRCSACSEVFTAHAPEEAQGPKFDESAVSIMALLRYGNGQPLNRLAHLQSSLKTPVPASTQWEVVSQSAVLFAPVYDELLRLAAQSPLLHNDDTYVRILELMGKRRAAKLAKGELDDPERTGLFTTGIVAKTRDERLIALYFSGRKHAGENLADLLKRRAAELNPPIQMADALNRNLPQGHTVIGANCLSHGRRGVVDQVTNYPAECRFLLDAFGEVFGVDARCKAEALSPDERLRAHQAQSGPVMESILAKANELLDEKKVEPNSDMGKALRYLINHWDALTLFLRVPGAPIDNNICERTLKKAIRHRKNSLFYKTERGARVGDLFMTLIETTVLGGENPFEYLTALQRFSKDVAERPADWLPWTFRATLARLEGRSAPADAAAEPTVPATPMSGTTHQDAALKAPEPSSPPAVLSSSPPGLTGADGAGTGPDAAPLTTAPKNPAATGAGHDSKLRVLQGGRRRQLNSGRDPAPAVPATTAGPMNAWDAALRSFAGDEADAAPDSPRAQRRPIGNTRR